ncbi:RNA-directed DNA polymerase, eukaryota [Tanacetum coccineum]
MVNTNTFLENRWSRPSSSAYGLANKVEHMHYTYRVADGLEHESDEAWRHEILCINKAMFGDNGSLDNPDTVTRPSNWLNSIREFNSLSNKLNDPTIIQSFRRPPCGGLEEEQYGNLLDIVQSVILSDSKDRWVWSLDSTGEFSVKSARLYIDDYLLPSVGAPTRWVKKVPIKINILAWKVSLDKLPTRLNLSLRGIEISSISCPICCTAGESCSHLLFSCIMARLLVSKVARWWELDIPNLFL